MTNPTVAPYAKEKCVHVRVAVKGNRQKEDVLWGKVDKIINDIKDIYPQATEVK